MCKQPIIIIIIIICARHTKLLINARHFGCIRFVFPLNTIFIVQFVHSVVALFVTLYASENRFVERKLYDIINEINIALTPHVIAVQSIPAATVTAVRTITNKYYKIRECLGAPMKKSTTATIK